MRTRRRWTWLSMGLLIWRRPWQESRLHSKHRLARLAEGTPCCANIASLDDVPVVISAGTGWVPMGC